MESAAAIPFGKKVVGAITPPPSKSHAIRSLLIASLAKGVSNVLSCGSSEDVEHLYDIVRRWRHISKDRDSFIIRPAERIEIPGGVYNCGGSATAARLLLALFSMSEGERIIDGDKTLRKRPVGAGIDVARSLGADVKFLEKEGFFPLCLRGEKWNSGRIEISDRTSSQFVSGMLIAAPLAEREVVIEARDPVSLPYIEMTIAAMRSFGVEVIADGGLLTVRPVNYSGAQIEIEKDYSAAAFFLCASAATDGSLEINGLGEESIQGDRRIVDILRESGADLSWKNGSLKCRGLPERPLDVDLADIPDLFPPLAALALKCPGKSVFRGAARLEAKESRRGSAIVDAINTIGGRASVEGDNIIVVPAEGYSGAVLDPLGDHRLAMAFAIMGLLAGGTTVLDPGCVKKSHPSFWSDFFNILK